jgi:hypothetical protein
MPRRFLPVVAPFLLVILVSSCDDGTTGPGSGVVDNTDFEASASFRFTVPADARSLLVVEGVTGSIKIAGVAESDTVVIIGCRRVKSESVADAEAHLGDLQVLVTSSGTRVDVTTQQPGDTHGRQYIVDYEIIIPASWETSAANVSGNVDVQSVAQDVTVRCTTGLVTVSDCTGDVEVDLTTGDIRLDGIHGSLDVEAVTGNVVAENYLPAGGVCEISLVTGAVTLEIPSTTSATFSAKLVTGLITLIGVTLDGASISPTRVTGTLGSGNGRIDLEAITGAITVTGF